MYRSYNEGGYTKKGKIHPDNLKDWKGYKEGEYLLVKKIKIMDGQHMVIEENKEIKRNADKYKTLMGSGANKKALQIMRIKRYIIMDMLW